MAKQLLQGQNLPFEEINLEQDTATRQRLSQENNGWRTVPMIFIGDEFIGGFQELSELHRSNLLLNKAKT
jgi:glutaredoxin 3